MQYILNDANKIFMMYVQKKLFPSENSFAFQTIFVLNTYDDTISLFKNFLKIFWIVRKSLPVQFVVERESRVTVFGEDFSI